MMMVVVQGGEEGNEGGARNGTRRGGAGGKGEKGNPRLTLFWKEDNIIICRYRVQQTHQASTHLIIIWTC